MVKVGNDIIKACLKKDRKAQFELYKLCYGFLFGICKRYYKNGADAEALLNQSFMKVLINLEKYRKEVPFNLWIRRITINTIFDEYRKNKKYKEAFTEISPFEEAQQYSDISFNDADLQFEAEELLGFLERLPDVSKRVFCLYAIDGYSHKEIAELMKISVGTSKWHVNNARKKLITMIEDKKVIMLAM